MSWNDVLFLVLAGMLLGAGLLVVTMRDIIRCGLAMIVSFGALAGIYVMLGAPIVAGAQVLVYIGAISVLILFAIMLTQTKAGSNRLTFQTQAIPAGIAVVILAVILSVVVTSTNWGASAAPTAADTEAVANAMFNDYVLPFEIVSVLLLGAVIGGIYLAKRDPSSPEDGRR